MVLQSREFEDLWGDPRYAAMKARIGFPPRGSIQSTENNGRQRRGRWTPNARRPRLGASTGFTLDLARGALLGPDGAEVPLRPKSFALLRLLVENAGRLVDRDGIMAAVWPDVVVGDEWITQCIRDFRKALGDEAQQLLRSVPKRGYQPEVGRKFLSGSHADFPVTRIKRRSVLSRLGGHRRAPWKTRRISIASPCIRYGTMYGVPAITSSRVPGQRPGRPLSPRLPRASTAWRMRWTVRAAASGLSAAICR